MIPKTAIALSGGVDSLVAAALLKDQGHEVIALHFLTGYEGGAHETRRASADIEELKEQARLRLAPLVSRLGLALTIVDMRSAFQQCVVDYFVTTYLAGRTPNPCLVCNPAIKFDRLFQEAARQGADRIATGHYARIVADDTQGMRLLKGVDPAKDQSYFMARMSQKQLARTLLPLGGLLKTQTRQIARHKQLIPASSNESQDICFIKDRDYGSFLRGQPGFKAQPGPIEDMSGRVIGEHEGLHLFTIGQRRGINCPAAQAYYVVRLDPARNCLVVGGKQDLFSRQCGVAQINWIAQRPQSPLSILVRVRYRHRAVRAMLVPTGQDTADVIFDAPEPAVTPGQGAVFYLEDEVLGGGWIQ